MDLKKYIGRAYEEFNCLDLVKEFYRDIFNLELREYYEGAVPNRKEVESLIRSNKGDFIRVKGLPRLGDIVVIKLFGHECHLGVIIDPERFLHSIKGTGSAIDRVARYQNMIEGYYRHREAHD